VTPQKPLRVTLINSHVYLCKQARGSKCFKLWISHPEVTSHLTNCETPVNMNSKSKAGKLAEPSTIFPQDHPAWRHCSALWSYLLLSQEELTVLCKSLMRTSLQGSYIHLLIPWSPSPFHPQERQLSSTLHWLQRPQPDSKMLIHSHSSLISMTHHRKHESIPKSTSSMCIILSECLLETNGRLYSKPIMVHLSGW